MGKLKSNSLKPTDTYKIPILYLSVNLKSPKSVQQLSQVIIPDNANGET